jgi:nucleotide-binding universal stress UspA family protein
MFKKVLVPVDGSRGSLKAVSMAAEIGRQFGSQVTLCHVLELPATTLTALGMAGTPGAGDAGFTAMEKAARDILNDAQAALALPVEQVSQENMLGHPAETIIRLAESGGYDLVVMGSRGLSEVRAFFLGSVSDKVSHHAPCPVLIVR